MDKEFIPYEQALTLKELGYKEKCFAFWDAYNGGTHLFFKHRIKYHWIIRVWKALKNTESESVYFDNPDYLEYIEGDNSILAPTYSQAFRWFREKHNIHGNVAGRYLYEITGVKSNQGMFSKEFETYEEAQLACLKKLIEIVKNEKI